MPKPISQRGFKVIIGGCSYSIDNDGKEKITITKDKDNKVIIWYGEEKVESVALRNTQCDRIVTLKLESSPDTETIRQQAEALYAEVKKILNVDERPKDYQPRFSSILEITPFNILDIKNASELEAIVNKSKTEK